MLNTDNQNIIAQYWPTINDVTACNRNLMKKKKSKQNLGPMKKKIEAKTYLIMQVNINQYDFSPDVYLTRTQRTNQMVDIVMNTILMYAMRI